MKKSFRTAIFLMAAVITVLVVSGCHHPYDRYPEQHPEPWTPSDVEMMLGGEDPMEGFNRSMFSCTDFLMSYVADPLGRVYTSIFPRPFISHFNNVCVNLEYPGRAVSSLLQAQWQAAGTETVRFLANSTLGIVGIFDVAQAWWDIPPAEADFGQAFAAWGIGPGHTFMLPIVPSLNGRDLIGLIFDTAFDLKTYIPYAGYATFLNRMTVAQDGYAMLVDGAADPYKNYRQLMLIRRELQLRMWFYKEAQRQLAEYKKVAEAREKGIELPPLPPSPLPPAQPQWLKFGNYIKLENFFSQGAATDTLRVSMFHIQRDRDWWYMPLSIFNSDFLRDGFCREVEMQPDRPKLRYCFWKAPELMENAPKPPEKLVIMLSGIGGVYNNGTMLALAEQFNDAGFMVMTMDSTFNWRFVVADGDCKLPGYLPDDAQRVRKAALSVLADLKARQWINEPEIIVCGYSMGGIQALKLAELEEISPELGVSRFIALNPPVSLGSALNKIDSMTAGSAGWTKSEMREKLITVAGNLLMKFMPHYLHIDEGADLAEYRKFMLPVSQADADVIAGIFLKLSLRELLFAVHRERPLAGFPEYRWGERNALYQQLDKVTFAEYAERILTPEYQGKSTAELLEKSSLRSIEKTLRNSKKIRVFHNIDDFLVTDDERAWFDDVLKDRVVWFSNGGHLGNFYYKMVLRQIVNAADTSSK